MECIPLKVLCLEDSPQDAEIIRELLLNAKYDLNMDLAATEKEFVSLLRSSKYDVILADFKLPGFDAFAALRWSIDICPNTPFICVSGSIGEETAVELLKQGAVDYVLKDRLGRLPTAINRALDDVKEREARRSAEEALLESEARYRALVEQVPIIAYTDSATQIAQTLYISPQFKTILGYDPQEWIADNDFWINIMHEDDRERILAEYTRTYATGEKFENEYRLITNQGSIIWIHDEAILIRDQSGGPLFWQGIMHDVTERKLAEEAQKLSETRMKSLYELSQKQFETEKELIEYGLEEAVKLTGSKIGFFHFVNTDQVNLDLYTWSSEVRKTCTALPDRHYSLDAAGVWADCVRTKQPAIYNDYPNLPEKKGYPEGHSPILRHMSVPIIDKDLVVVVCGVGNKETPYDEMDVLQLQLYIDGLWKIINRKRSEQALQESETRFRTLFEQAAVGVAQVETLSGHYVRINQKFCDIVGYTLEEMQNLTFQDIISPDDHEIVQYFMIELIKGRISEYSLEIRNIHKDGHIIWIDLTVSPMWAPGGQPDYHIVIEEDISQRKQAEKELQESEEQYRSLFENVPDGVFRTTLEGAIIAANPALIRMLGYDTQAELKNRNAVDLYVDQNDRKEYINLFQKNNEVHNVELHLKRKDGQPIIVLDNSRIINDRGNTYFEGTLTDITALKKVEEELNIKIEETIALYETSQLLSTQLELPNLLKVIVERAAILLEGNSGFLYLYDETRADLELIIETTGVIPVGVRLNLGEGLAGRVAQTLKPMILDDYSRWEGRSPKNASIDFTAIIEVPMVYSGKLIGVLGVEEIGLTNRRFNEDDMRLLSLFATQAASAVHNARLFEETRNRAVQLSLLYDAGLALNSRLDEHEQLEFLLKIAIDTLNGERAAFYRVDNENNRISFEVGVGFKPEILKKFSQISIPTGEESGFVGWVVNNRIPINIKDLKADSRYIEVDSELQSGTWVPVEHDNQLQGVLCVCSTRIHAFQPEHERLLMLFANQAAVAMENARLIKETQHQLSQLNALHEIDLAIAGSVDLRISLGVILNQATQQLGIDAATILLMNPHTQILEYAAGIGFHTNALQHTHIKIGEGFAGRAALERKLIHIPDLTTRQTGFLRSPGFASEGFITYTVKPLIARGQIKGVLEIFHRVMHKPNQTWFDFLDAFASQSAIAIDSAELFQNLQMANTGLNMAYDNTLEGWGRALELRDQETEGHTRRAADITLKLARALGVEETDLIHIYRGALLHDIGKMGVPDSIVLKPGKLTLEEWEIMRKHPQYAYDMLSPISFLKQALDIPYYHHEKWDGSGYPQGLKGDLIPLAARIFAVVDVYDALTSDRPYRPAWIKEEALKYISTNSGTHFDPHVADAFLKLI